MLQLSLIQFFVLNQSRILSLDVRILLRADEQVAINLIHEQPLLLFEQRRIALLEKLFWIRKVLAWGHEGAFWAALREGQLRFEIADRFQAVRMPLVL